MNKRSWYFLAASLAVLILAGVAVNSSWLGEVMVRRLLQTRPGIVVRQVHIDHQRFSFPGRIEWDGARAVMEINGKALDVQVPRMGISGLQTLLSGERRIFVDTDEASVRYDAGQAEHVKASLTVDGTGVSGPVSVLAAGWDQWRAADVAFFLVVHASAVELRALDGAAYGGRITGKVLADLPSASAAGSYVADVFIDAIEMDSLAAVDPGIAGQLRGAVRGALKIGGNFMEVQSIDADLTMPAGGQISASLLAALTQYLPPTSEKKRLDLLIRAGGKIAMETFSFVMKGGAQGRFAGELHLRSREINLELNLEHEINTDGTLASLIEYGQRFLK